MKQVMYGVIVLSVLALFFAVSCGPIGQAGSAFNIGNGVCEAGEKESNSPNDCKDFIPATISCTRGSPPENINSDMCKKSSSTCYFSNDNFYFCADLSGEGFKWRERQYVAADGCKGWPDKWENGASQCDYVVMYNSGLTIPKTRIYCNTINGKLKWGVGAECVTSGGETLTSILPQSSQTSAGSSTPNNLPAVTIRYKCKESDTAGSRPAPKGKNILTGGLIYITTNEPSTEQFSSYKDSCKSGTELTEYWCSSNNWQRLASTAHKFIMSEIINCAADGGTCVESPTGAGAYCKPADAPPANVIPSSLTNAGESCTAHSDCASGVCTVWEDTKICTVTLTVESI